jgi:hypothetical protein
MKSILDAQERRWLITRGWMAVTARVTLGENGLMKEPHSFHHDGYKINLARDKRSQGEKSIKTYPTNTVTKD